MQERGVPVVKRVRPVNKPLNIHGQRRKDIRELVVHAEYGREHNHDERGEHREHAHERNGRSQAAANAAALKRIDGRAKHEHENNRPHQNGHRQGQHVENKTKHIDERRSADNHPHLKEMAARIIGALGGGFLAYGFQLRLLLTAVSGACQND